MFVNVIDEQNRPIQNALVAIAFGPTHKDLSYLTNKEGHCNIKSLIPGEYKVLVAVKDKKVTKKCEVFPNKVTAIVFNI